MLVRIAAFAINTQWQVLWWGDHLSTWEPTYTHTYTQTHKHIYTNTGAQVFLGLAYTLAMCHASGCLPCQQHTTHTKRSTKAHTHTAWRLVRVRTNPCMQTLHTVTLLSPGLECQNEYREVVHVCVCVCAYLYVCICMCVCSMLTDDMLKADTTHTLPVTAGFIARPRPLWT